VTVPLDTVLAGVPAPVRVQELAVGRLVLFKDVVQVVPPPLALSKVLLKAFCVCHCVC
jgi:hypothetical protein